MLADVLEELIRLDNNDRVEVGLKMFKRHIDISKQNTNSVTIARNILIEDNIHIEERLAYRCFLAEGLKLKPVDVVFVVSDAGNSIIKDVTKEHVLKVASFLWALVDKVVGEGHNALEEDAEAVNSGIKACAAPLVYATKGSKGGCTFDLLTISKMVVGIKLDEDFVTKTGILRTKGMWLGRGLVGVYRGTGAQLGAAFSIGTGH